MTLKHFDWVVMDDLQPQVPLTQAHVEAVVARMQGVLGMNDFVLGGQEPPGESVMREFLEGGEK